MATLNSLFRYTGTGAAQVLPVPPYLDRSHIFVYIDGDLDTSWTWLTSGTIRVTAPAGQTITVQRKTSPNARLVDYNGAVPLTEADLDTDSLQAFYLAQETRDIYLDLVALSEAPLESAVAAATQANVSAAAAAASAASVAASLAAYLTSAGGTLVRWIQTGVGAVLRAITDKLRERVSVGDFGVIGNGTDETAGILAAVAEAQAKSCNLYWPKPLTKYVYSSTIFLTDGIRMVGEGAPKRWRTPKVRIEYWGSGAAVELRPGVGQGIDSVEMDGIQIDGRNAAAGCHGLFLNASAVDSYIEGVHAARSSFLNFPGNQILHDGVVFDVTYRRVTAMNPDRAADHCVRITNSALADGPSQVTLDDCWIAPYTAGKWSVLADICQDLRLIGGTLAPYVLGLTGANGVQCNGGLTILGTHIEGTDPTNTGAIGIQYKGSNGGVIAPSGCSLFGQGVVIGDGTAAAARGYTIGGSIGNNTVADIVITSGGSRVGTLGEIGYADGMPVILDNRRDVDGIYEVVNVRGGVVSNVKVLAKPGTDTDPGLSFSSASTRGFFDTGTGIGWTTGGGKQGELRGTDAAFRTRICPGTPPGVIQFAVGLYAGLGVPNNSFGGSGEFYFRGDPAGALTRIYQHNGTAWVGIV